MVPGCAAAAVGQRCFGRGPCWNFAPVLLEPLFRTAGHFYLIRAVKIFRRPSLKLSEKGLVAIAWSAEPVQLILRDFLLPD